jgi:hypothetical protein
LLSPGDCKGFVVVICCWLSGNIIAVTSLRRVVLILLLLTVPFQAAVAATGLICPNEAHHSQSWDSTHHDHDAAVPAHGHHAPGVHGSDSVTGHDTTPGSLDDPGKCSICSECCFSAAAVPSTVLDFDPPNATFKVSAIVDTAMISRAGDGLFRPPRSRTL